MGKNDGYDVTKRMHSRPTDTGVKNSVYAALMEQCRQSEATRYAISDAKGGTWCFAKGVCAYQLPADGDLPECLKPHFVAMEKARQERGEKAKTRRHAGDTTVAMTTIAYPKKA